MIERKCDYCNKKAIYLCDFLSDNWIRIAGCEEHKTYAIAKQHNVKMIEEFKQRSKNFGKYYLIKEEGNKD